MKISCIIVDDELPARLGLQALIEEIPELDLIGSCSNGLKAIETISEKKPHLVFLDIQMPGVNGFEVIASLPKPRPHVIFTTAHDQYAIKAFEISAVDYLLKPFSDERFEQATKKAISLIQSNQINSGDPLQTLIDKTTERTGTNAQLIHGAATPSNMITFKSGGKIHQVDSDEITHLEAYDYYVKVYFGKQMILIRESMKQMEKMLPQFFVRIHKSHIVNTNKITEFGKLKDGADHVLLKDGQYLKVSRNYKAELMKALS